MVHADRDFDLLSGCVDLEVVPVRSRRCRVHFVVIFAGMAWPRFGDPSMRVLRVTLEEIEPVVWRRVAVPSDTKLPKLNRMLEAAMGWEGYHLHMFRIGELRFGQPDLDDMWLIDERKVTAAQVLPHLGSELTWDYDFGDGWSHRVVVEDGDDPEASGPLRPQCLAGERACPPEDCGGPRRYMDLMQIIVDPTHEEYEDLMEWLPLDFDPTAFDVDTANRRLHSVR